MFEHPLPDTFKPAKLARQQGKLQGFMPLSKLTQLAADCVSGEGQVQAELLFSQEGGRSEVHGTATAELQLICQRCLEPVRVALKAEVAVGFVQNDEQAEHLPEHLEPFLLDDEEVPVADLLEQELILAMPIVAYHPQCEPPEGQYQSGGADEPVDSKPNPFAVLEQLKEQGDNNRD